MSFKIFKLKIVEFTSPASRFTYKYKSYCTYQIKHKKLSTYITSNSGRNSTGRIVFRSKASKKIKKKSININYNYR